MGSVATVTSKGQVTIPREVRRRLGVKEGDRVEFVTEGGVTLIRPLRAETNPFVPYVGALGTFPAGAADVKAWVRDLRDEDDAGEGDDRS